jgi:membrane protease YdiL (CAAX protease family)
MKKFKNFALKKPFLFGIVLFFLYAFLTALAYPIHYLFPETEAGQLYGDAGAKLIVFLVFLAVLWRFGWISLSGINRLGNAKIWPTVVGLLVYCVLTQLYAFTGSITIALPDPQLATADWFLAFSTAMVEETMARGLVLAAMILTWGNTKQGQLKAILLSSLLFGLAHLINIMIRPIGVVLMQALIVTLPGIFAAVLVLVFRTLWPAIMIHWFGNAAVNIKLIGHENYQETFTMWIIWAISLIPIIVYSAYLFRGLLQNPETLTKDLENPLIGQNDKALS